ncbi:MAG: hypothetical protein SGPRY_006097, partial [Prymnesium sp.]
ALRHGAAAARHTAWGAFSLRPLATSFLLLLLVAAGCAYLLFGRLATVYGTAFLTLLAYWAVKKLCRTIPVIRKREDAFYACVHTVFAGFVCRRVVALRSFYVKFAQYISGRADLVPPEWVKALQRVQDEMPPSPPRHVSATMASEFGVKRSSELFEQLDMKPLASASVAQHENIEALMRSDMAACLRIARAMVWLNPELQPVRTVLEAWEGEMSKECNFTFEANNLEEVASNLRRAGIEAIVPKPIQGLVGVRAFVMTFEEGFKVTDREALAVHSVDCEALMLRIVQIYAQQVLIDGFFNADPHPGNLMVRVKDGMAIPVLLDFGMTVRLTEPQRLGYARVALAAHQMDLFGLQQAVSSLGVATNQSESQPDRDLEFWRFFLRDTGGREEASEQRSAFFSLRKSQRADDKRSNKPTRKLASIPPSLIFFFRVIELIRGLCATLGVRVRYMEVLAASARIALTSLTPPPLRALTLSPPLPGSLSGQATNSRLLLRLTRLLTQLCEHGKRGEEDEGVGVGAGVQVCVMHARQVVAQASAGFLSTTDGRGMRLDTPMPLAELSLLLPVTALHSLLGSHPTLTLDSQISPAWPGCALIPPHFTLSDALSHRVPIDGSFTWRQSAEQLGSLETQFTTLSLTPLLPSSPTTPRHPSEPTDGATAKCRSSGVAQGTLLAGIIEGVSGKPYPQTLTSALLDPLGLEGERGIVGANMGEQMSMNCASLSAGFAAQMENLRASLEANRTVEQEAEEVGPDKRSNQDAKEGGGEEDENGTKPRPNEARALGGIGAMAAAFGHEIPLNACVVNSPPLRSGCSPALGAYGTAHAVCSLLGAAARGEVSISPHAISQQMGVEGSMIFGDRVWGRGMQR